MAFSREYAYLAAVALFGLVWLGIFTFKKSVRGEMLALSCLAALFGFFQYFYTFDYWRPLSAFGGGGRLDVESFLLSFFYGGVGASLYEAWFWKTKNPATRPGSRTLTFAAGFAALASMFAGVFILGWNSIYVTALVLLTLGVFMIFYRPSLLPHALYSGVLFTALTALIACALTAAFPGVIRDWWMLDRLSGVLVRGIPIEEFLFAFSWGFFAGPASELLGRMRFGSLGK